MEGDLKALRALYDIREVLTDLGVEMSRDYGVCPLPQHAHHNFTASFSVFISPDGVQRFKCHGNCGLQGDVIDLAGYLWVSGYHPADPVMLRRAVDALQARREMTWSLPAGQPKRQGLPQKRYLDFLPIGSEGRAYAHQRGLSDHSIELFGLGQDRDYLTIPAFTNGKLMSIKKRALKTGMRYLVEKGSRKSLFNHDAVKYARTVVFYVKAEIPAMLMTQLGYQACAPGMGETSFEEEWRRALAFARIVVVGDNDDAGVRAASQRAMDLGGLLKFPPGPFKDLDEWILADQTGARKALDTWVREASA
nr:hypothetical protein [Anaerolineae bacterium]